MKPLKLQTKMALLILTLLVFVILILSSVFAYFISNSLEDQIGNRALNIAKTVAIMPEVNRGFKLEDPSTIIQPLAEEVRIQTGAEFVVVGNIDSVRYSHPVTERIGQTMVGGDNDRALLQGESYTSKATGTLGPSLRGKTPIFDESGEIIGIVSVGFLIEDIELILDSYQRKVLFLTILVSVIGIIGALYIAKGFKKAIFGLEPREIASLFIEKNAILESIHEGIIAINVEGNITLVNQKAYQIINKHPSENIIGKNILEILPHTKMLDVLHSKESQFNQELKIGDNEIIANRVPIFDKKQIVGVVSSFRNKTEIDQLTKELSQVQSYAEALRAQTHEYSNKLYTISGLIQLASYQEAIDFINKETTDYQNLVEFLMSAIPDTMIAALLLGKYNRAHELKTEMIIDNESSMKDIPDELNQEKIVTIIGNLIDNAFEATLSTDKNKIVKIFMTDIGNDLIFEIEDSGSGVQEEDIQYIFQKGFSKKQGEDRGIGLYLVDKAVKYLNGYITVSQSDLGGAVFTVAIPKRTPKSEA
ncbi:ATP-binding protein [Chengkuizengella axinellae]|uniref:histidine kinase n=1 Tax=Chengkuizengella axinellae TaxID=3064388 RepID=A0ABT9J3M1_9BACL|nr:sensor histidine kinase [Chengkuizengella sp. 2205SS18-9]MDP5276220.1 sensor histidine kinase [Chengkuizengella sp. 2205SS18-9]